MLNEQEAKEKSEVNELIERYGNDATRIYNQALKDFSDYISYEWALDNIYSISDITKIIGILKK